MKGYAGKAPNKDASPLWSSSPAPWRVAEFWFTNLESPQTWSFWVLRRLLYTGKIEFVIGHWCWIQPPVCLPALPPSRSGLGLKAPALNRRVQVTPSHPSVLSKSHLIP